ncbi:DNA polymerase III subunit alpha, partial [Escherichia coli]
MYAKSYIAFDGSAGARTAKTTPDDRYTCHSSSV